MKPGTLVKARLGGYHRFLFYVDPEKEGCGMYLSTKTVIDIDMEPESIHQILIGDTCHWLHAYDFEEVK